MPKSEILDGNLLIANFMDYEIKGSDFIFPKEMYHLYKPHNLYEFEGGDYNFDTDVSGMEFHTSWDWLMLVVEKIESLSISNFHKQLDRSDVSPIDGHFWFNCFKNEVNIFANVYYWQINNGVNGLKTHKSNSKLESYYYAVIEFIKWYNKNK